MEEVTDSCRICLTGTAEFISMECTFDFSSINVSYLEAYNFCTNLSADLSDSFPNIICEECAWNITFVYDVIQKALNSDKLLRAIIEGETMVVEALDPDHQKSIGEEQIFTKYPKKQPDHLQEENISLTKNHNEIEPNEAEESDSDHNDVEHSAFEEYEVTDIGEEHLLEVSEIKEEDISVEALGPEPLSELSQHSKECDDESQSIEHLNITEKLPKDSSTISTEIKRKEHTTKPSKKPLQKTLCCEICGKFFSTKQKLKTHNLVHTKEKNFQCSLCPKRHATIFRLRDHMKSHENIRDHECGVCKERFLTKNTLKCHQRRHTGERPYKCEICGMTFSQGSIMKTHAALHTGKTVECNLCSKRFTRPSQMILHRRSHTGERPYECTLCPNSYRQKSHLDRHLDTHMGVKHTCQVCGKSYSKKSTLNSHMFVHSATKQFKCVYCQMEFKTKPILYRHLKSIHKTTNSTKNLEMGTNDYELTILESES